MILIQTSVKLKDWVKGVPMTLTLLYSHTFFPLQLKAFSSFVCFPFCFLDCFFLPCSFAHLPPTWMRFQINCHADAEKWQSGEAPSLNLSSLINTDMLLFLKCHGEGSLNKTSVSHHKRNLPENEPERNPRETSALRVTDPSSNLSYIKSHKHPQRSKIEARRHMLQIREAEAAFAL